MNSLRAFVALGSNLPFEGAPPAMVLQHALAAMRDANLIVTAASGIWETQAWPPSDQPDYYNAVVALNPAGLSPQSLYEQLSVIEARFGRERRDKNAARTLDLDLIAMDGLVGTFGEITLPHPRMHERAFVLAPLAEVAPDWRHPGLGETSDGLLARLDPRYRYRRVGNL
jgi:2-amino-4-hydroxy-6-hydroxymethyldihydropteridine diphosphokinase